MRESDRKVMRKLSLFRDMRDTNFDKLADAAYLQCFPKHMTLITEGELPDFLHIVVDGLVKVFSVHEGRESTFDIIRPVTTFILAAAIRDAVYLNSARTLTSAQIIMIPAKTTRGMIGRDAAFARAIVNELAERYRVVTCSLKNVKLRSGVERLANWILQNDAQHGYRQFVELTFDKRTLASYLGMTPVNFSRSLSLLSQYGVKRSGRFLEIEDAVALAQFARSNTLIDYQPPIVSKVRTRGKIKLKY